MLTRRQFISASAVVAGMAGVPVGSAIASAAISPLIASKVKRIRLISQKSDDSWHHPPMVWTPAECYRDHELILIADNYGPQLCRMLILLHAVANSTNFGDVEPGFLYAQNYTARRLDSAEDRWQIRLQLRETTVSRLEPWRVLDMATGKMWEYSRQIKAVNFRAYLPRVEPFPKAEPLA